LIQRFIAHQSQIQADNKSITSLGFSDLIAPIVAKVST
jgi:hypothetical protein